MTRPGGYAALLQACCYVFGFVLLVTVMNPGDTAGWTSVQKLEFVLQREALFQLWNLVIYVVFGAALVVLTTVLHRALEQTGSLWMPTATPFGFIWAGLVVASGMIASVGLSEVSSLYASDPREAARLWSTLSVVQRGLGGGVEFVGGVWVLLVSVASLRARRLFSKALNGIGIIVGLAGIATVVPPWSGLGAVFGLAQIVWFIGVGVVLLRAGDEGATASTAPRPGRPRA